MIRGAIIARSFTPITYVRATAPSTSNIGSFNSNNRLRIIHKHTRISRVWTRGRLVKSVYVCYVHRHIHHPYGYDSEQSNMPECASGTRDICTQFAHWGAIAFVDASALLCRCDTGGVRTFVR